MSYDCNSVSKNRHKARSKAMLNGTYQPSDISGLLKFAADNYGERACIKWADGQQIYQKTYTEMYNDSISAARHIYSAVGKKRVHIAITGKTSYDYLTFFNGIFIAGCVAVPIGDSVPPEEAAELFTAADCSAVIFDESTENTVKETVSDEMTLIKITDRFSDGGAVLPESKPEECALIMFTSGTTGGKKGVMLTQSALITNVFFKEMSFEGGKTALNVLPLNHIFSFSCDYLKNLRDGVTVCLSGGAAGLYRSLLTFEPDFVRLVPVMTLALLKKIEIEQKRHPELSPREAGERIFGKNLRSIISSGAKLPADRAEEFEKAGVSVRQGYGMTEAGPRIAVPDGRTDAASAGAIVSFVKARIENGELQIKSPSVMTGYYKEPEETAKAFTPDGWLKTGDTGYITDDGILYITGRVKNLIILSNGENISPEEAENRLTGYPPIKEALVKEKNDMLFAEIYPEGEITDETAKQAAKAIAEYNSSVSSEREIADFSLRSTPFPRTESGKIIRT